jgi:hypothetical protein
LLPADLKSQTGIPNSNKGDLDGAAMTGFCFPWDSHRNGNSNPNNPTQFATRGISSRIEANAGFGNGWKFGLGVELIRCNLDGEALSAFLEKGIALPNFFLTKELDEDPYYASTVWFVQMENEINYGRFRIAPHAKIGISAYGSYFSNTYRLKEQDTNYEREVEVRPIAQSLPGFVYGAGVKAGFSPGGNEGKFLLFCSLDVLRYRTITGLEYRTSDILDNTTYTQNWFGSTIAYYTFMIGGAFYLR